jgi:hypothetical protein
MACLNALYQSLSIIYRVLVELCSNQTYVVDPESHHSAYEGELARLVDHLGSQDLPVAMNS